MSSADSRLPEVQLARMRALAGLELVGAAAPVEAVLQRIVEETERLLPASGGASILLWNGERGGFVQSASSIPGQAPGLATDRVRSGGVTRRIVERRRPYVCADVGRDPFAGGSRLLSEFGLRAFAGVPLLAEGTVLGVLFALERRPRAFSVGDLDFLVALAGRAAAALTTARLVEALRREATHDRLTGLLNRTSFRELAEAELERARRHGRATSLLFIDIDRFKAVNDAHGHRVGDRVLQEVAGRLAASCRAGDLCFRYGGEELVGLLAEADGAAALGVARRILTRVGRWPVVVDGREIPVTVSIGVDTTHGDADLDDLLGCADRALYEAKSAGRDCVRAAPRALTPAAARTTGPVAAPRRPARG